MKTLKSILVFSVVLALIGVTAYGLYSVTVGKNVSSNFGSTRVCTITETKVAVGNEASTEVLSAGSRQWAVVQQPTNATNTTAFSFAGDAVIGSGYELYPGSASTTDYLKFGFATDLPTSASVEAITSTGSTTLKVIECK